MLSDYLHTDLRDKAYGVGLRLYGLWRLFGVRVEKSRNYSLKQFLVEHFDFTIDWASSEFYGLEQNHLSLSLSIR